MIKNINKLFFIYLKTNHRYHLVNPSLWPLLGLLGGFCLTIGGVLYMHRYIGGWSLFLTGFLIIIYTMFVCWWQDIIIEATFEDCRTPTHLSYAWSFGSLAGICLVIQIITGLFLATYYIPNIKLAYDSVQYIIMHNAPYGWFFRYTHTNGVSMFFIVVYVHLFRGSYYGSYIKPRQYVWCSGVILLLLMMGAAFTGYVLPWSQMSFWGATIITSMVTVLPKGQLIAEWGGYVIKDPTLIRFFVIHYLLPFLIIVFTVIHLLLLLEINPNIFKIFKKVRVKKNSNKPSSNFLLFLLLVFSICITDFHSTQCMDVPVIEGIVHGDQRFLTYQPAIDLLLESNNISEEWLREESEEGNTLAKEFILRQEVFLKPEELKKILGLAYCIAKIRGFNLGGRHRDLPMEFSPYENYDPFFIDIHKGFTNLSNGDGEVSHNALLLFKLIDLEIGHDRFVWLLHRFCELDAEIPYPLIEISRAEVNTLMALPPFLPPFVLPFICNFW